MKKARYGSLTTMFCCAFAAIFALPGHAADVSWTGATDADWATASNWDGGVPQAGDSVTIPSGGIVTCAGPFTDTEMSNRVWVACTDFTLASGGKIDVSEKGYGSSATGRTPYGPGHGSIKGGGGRMARFVGAARVGREQGFRFWKWR